MKQIIAEITKSVTPSDAATRSKKKIADAAFELVKEEIAKFPEVTDMEFGGSYAKGTWLSGDMDMDIFLRFKNSVSEKNFEQISRKIGFGALKDYSPHVRYSEHPYVEAEMDDTKINVVPFYDVEAGSWKSSTDRSPFHTRFMKKSLTPKMRTEVRILKAFLKANGIYGAEIAKQGLSGYVSEVLILNFGSFENVIKSVSQITEGQIIGKTPREFETSVVIVDPIDENRNLAAAISDESLGRFVLAARAFQKKPSSAFFRRGRSRMSKYWGNVLTVKFAFGERGPDMIQGQIRRMTALLATRLKLGGFTVLRSKSHAEKDRAYLIFLLESIEIPKIYRTDGPEFFRGESSEKYISKNLKSSELMWVGSRKITSLRKRRHVKADKFLADFLRKNISTGMPKGLQADFGRGFSVTVGRKSMSKSIKEVAGELVSTDGILLHFS